MTQLHHPAERHLCVGARAIAEFLGCSPRQAYHLIAKDRIPHFRTGRTVCARKLTLLEWIVEQDAKSKASKAHSGPATA